VAKTKTGAKPTSLDKNARVTLTRALPLVPEGTVGKIKVVNGLTWPRYWVQFDNGQWVGSVSEADLVAADDYEGYKQRLADEAARPTASATAPAATAAGADVAAAGAPAGAGSKVPAHLLERSQRARAKKAESEAG